MTSPTILRCLIVDDEPLAVRLLEGYASRHPALNCIASFIDAEEALQACKEMKPDLVFLDISMPGINGIDFAAELPESTRSVFITAYDNYALDGFKVNAIDYLLKPVSYEEFCRSVDRVVKWKQSLDALTSVSSVPSDNDNSVPVNQKTLSNQDSLAVKSEYRLILIPVKDILYMEGLKDYVKIYSADQTKPVLTLASLKSLEARLPDNFMRVHRSFIVNIAHVKVFRKNTIYFKNGSVPVSESCRKSFLRRIGLDS